MAFVPNPRFRVVALASVALAAFVSSSRAQTPQLLVDLNTGISKDSFPSRFYESPRGDTWFTAYPTGATMPALYTTDGTTGNTTKVTDLHPLHIPQMIFTDDWKAWFVNYTASEGWELWQSDGTPTGTGIVTDMNAGTGSSLPRDLTVCAGELYHAAYDEEHGYELCRRGVRIADIHPGPAGSNPTGFVRCGNFLFFSADDGTTGQELWVLPWRDPTNPNPVPRRVLDIRTGALGSYPKSLVAHKNVLYFTADDGVSGRELWRSDGTGSNTQRVADIAPGPADGIPDGLLTATPVYLFFVGNDQTHGREPWFSTGFVNGTNMIADLRPGPEGSDPREFTPLHSDRVAFSAEDGTHGRELWWTTALQPTLVDLVPGARGSNPRDLFFSSNDLYCAVDDPLYGTEIWTVESLDMVNPRRLADLRQGFEGSRPPGGYAFDVAFRHVIFRADDGVHGVEPWVVDAGGISRTLGQGCGGELRAPTLITTAPRIGANCQIDGFGLLTLTQGFAVVFLSAKPLFPINVGLCELQLDPFTMQLIAAIAARTRFSTRLAIPNDPGLLGIVVRVGATVVPSSDPFFGFDLMNVADLRLGY
ncbi:MAG: hypothetical protein H6832_07980 [Planctomycetes bacterium]|nr:hypothetical protein [Planctomycetota bacterium]MCB9918327.1 hypothetical protein [Planctomycetota bacterium]